MNARNLLFLFVLICSINLHALGQKQLVLLKKQKVILRLNPGDDFVYSLKGVKGKHESYVNNLYDTAVLVHKTIVPFHKIDRIYFRRSTFANRIGALLVVAGVGIFIIDQFNSIVVHGEDPSLDEKVVKISVTSLALGLPLMLIHKKSQRMKNGYHLLTVKKGSVFYEEPLQQMVIEN